MFVKLIVLCRKLYWFILRPTTTGVKCLIRYDDKVLLIRNSYSTDVWTLPGGGVKLSEKPESAVRREVLEEIGFQLDDVGFIGKYESDKEYKRDTVYCFHSELTSSPVMRVSKREVAEAKWFNKDQIPNNLSTSVLNSLKLVDKKKIV